MANKHKGCKIKRKRTNIIKKRMKLCMRKKKKKTWETRGRG